MVSKRVFSKEQLDSLQKKIAEVEQLTSGEIIVHTISQSGNYLAVPFLGALLGMSVAPLFHFLPLPFLEAIAAFIGFQVFSIPFILRKILPKWWSQQEVEKSAFAHFVTLGLTETKDRTGILIFISELEHRVVVLADKGIHEKVGKEYWGRHVAQIRDGIRAGKGYEALIGVLDEMGRSLKQYFPRAIDDKNELSNVVKTDDQFK